MEAMVRYQNTWRFLRVAAGAVIKRLFAYECEKVDPPAPYLVLANHNTDLDPALVALSFPKFMYFVASEHVFRRGFKSLLLRHYFAPISRMKGATDASAALEIVRRLRKGNSVCLFAEGNRSFNGVTGPIFPATGKLAKASGATLITYRLEGGYLTTPRWGRTRRKGRMRGYVVGTYTPEQLGKMSAEEVNAAIARDLHEDAFERQAADPCPYKGERLAEGLENALFICPKCGRISTLKSEGDRFFCECGLSTRYNVLGFFEKPDAPFATVRDWDVWQTEKLAELAAHDGFFLANDGLRLTQIDESHEESETARGALRMDTETLTLGEKSFPLAKISDMAVYGTSTLIFTCEGAHYEIKSISAASYYCGRKYFMLYQLLKEKR